MPDGRAREIAEAWNEAVNACNEAHGTGGMDDYQICDACGIAALTRERDEENAACAKAVCEGCEEGWRVERQLDGARALYHVVPSAVREDYGHSWITCDATAIRQRRTPGATEGETTDG
jgi:hypothetical protein